MKDNGLKKGSGFCEKDPTQIKEKATSALSISFFVFASLSIAETFQHLQVILKSYHHTAEYCRTAVSDTPTSSKNP